MALEQTLYRSRTSSPYRRYLCRRGVSRLVLVLVPLVSFCFAAGPLRAEPTEQQRAHMRRAFDAVRTAGELYQSRQFEQAGAELITALQAMEQGLREADAETYKLSSSIIDRVERAHAMLQLEGIVLPPFERPVHGKPWKTYATAASKPARFNAAAPPPTNSSLPNMDSATEPPANRARNRRRPPTPTEPPATDGISFVSQVAPMLKEKCGRCHIQQTRGDLALDSFATIMRGPAAGVIVFAGDPIGSRLVEVIETGDMPRGGQKVSPAELQMLKDWITQGAKFDGEDPNAKLTALDASSSGNSGPLPMDAAPKPAAAVPAGPTTVSFARQIAPLLVDNCSGCHINAQQLRGGLNMNTLAQMMRGGDSGAIVEPGNGDGSLLVRKLRGQEGQRMPAGGRPPLSDENIQLISTWINEGAKLDSGSDDQPLPRMVIEVWAKNATAEELSQRREELARSNWQLGAPQESRGSAVEQSTDQVFVMGNLRDDEIARVANAAKIALDKAAAALPGAKKDGASTPFKGKITIFAFMRRYDYAEFSKMVERREIPPSWTAHWQTDGVDAYIALTTQPGEDVKQLSARLLAPMASLLIAGRGDSPRWFREGLGRVAATRNGGRDFEMGKLWDAELPQAIAIVKSPSELIEGKLPPEQADLIGYGIGKTLFQRRGYKQLDNLLQELEKGTPFEDAFSASFQVPLENFVNAWFGRPTS